MNTIRKKWIKQNPYYGLSKKSILVYLQSLSIPSILQVLILFSWKLVIKHKYYDKLPWTILKILLNLLGFEI